MHKTILFILVVITLVGCEPFDDKFKIHNHRKQTILMYKSNDSNLNKLINYLNNYVAYNSYTPIRYAMYYIKPSDTMTMFSVSPTWEEDFKNNSNKPMPWFLFVIDSSKQTMDTTILLKNNLVTTYRLDVDYLQKRNWVLDIW